MSSVIENLKRINASMREPQEPPQVNNIANGTASEIDKQPKPPLPHAYLQCPVSYLPPEEWREMMELLDILLRLLELMPKTVENAAGRVLQESKHTRQEMTQEIAGWREINRLAMTQLSTTIRQQTEALEQAQRGSEAQIKALADKLFPLAGIAAGAGAMLMGMIWMACSLF